MRILQLTPKLPYPPNDGGRIAMLQIARAVQRAGAEIRVLSLATEAAADTADAGVNIEAVPADVSLTMATAVRALRMGLTPFVGRFFSPEFAEKLRAVLRESSFDVIQFESLYMLPYLPIVRSASDAVAVLRAHNIEFSIWEQLTSRQTTLARRLAFRATARAVRRYEIRHLNSCDAVLPISADDAARARALGCNVPIHVLPVGVQRVSPAPPPAPSSKTVAFLGALDYRPNQEAAIWIGEELRPRLLQLVPDARLRVAGRNPPRWLRELLRQSSLTIETVDDARAYIEPMNVVIAPALSGGGIRVKILEAMSWGKAIVSTTLGAESIGVRDGENILIADDADAFAKAISALLRDPPRAQAIGAAARTFVERHYAIDVLARDLLTFYQSLIAGRQRPLPASEAETLASSSRKSSSSDHPHM